MNTEIVKWIELWLDSAGERVYQPALVSALAHNGYAILHNTSHNSLELGKDIICRDANGDLLALQLKGNPGSRLTISQWQQLLPQIVQLVALSVPPILSQKQGESHRPILVTNGQIEEDVQAAIAYFNHNDVPKYAGAKPLEIWSRGKLIELLSGVAESVWPGNLTTQLQLMKGIVSDTRNSVDESDIQSIAEEALDWKTKPSVPLSFARITGLATLISIFVSPYVAKGNLYEATKAKAISIGIVAGYLNKHKLRTPRHNHIYGLMRADLFDLLAAFAEGMAEYLSKSPAVADNIVDEFGVFYMRKILIASLVAVHMLETGEEADEKLRDIVFKDVDYPFLDCERLIPPFLAIFWAKDAFSSSRRGEYECMSVLSTLIKAARQGELISSYYTVEEVALWKYKNYLGREWHDIDRDQRENCSQFAYSIIALLAKRNWKRTSKFFWPDVTKLLRISTRIPDGNQFAFVSVDDAIEENHVVIIPRSWDELLADIQATPEPSVPKALRDDTALLLLLIIFLPYRATNEIILWLDRKLSKTWY